jgi:hypothetical protein
VNPIPFTSVTSMAHANSSASNLSINDVYPEGTAPRPRVRLIDVAARPKDFEQIVVKAEDGTTFQVDTRHFPILVLKLSGQPSEIGAKRYYEWLWDMTRYAASQGKKIVVINDFSKADVPPPVVRKYMAEEAAKIQTHEGFGHWVPVLPNAMIRGLATALVWMSGGNDKKQAHFTGTVEEAIAKSKKLFADMKHEVPDVDPDIYMFPA